MKASTLIIRLLRQVNPVRGWMIVAALLSTCTVVCGIGLLAVSAYLITTAATHPSLAAISIPIVGVRFFGIARGVFRYLERIVSHRATFRLLARLRTWFYVALEPLLPARLSEQGRLQALRSGDLLQRAVGDIDLLQNFYIRIMAPPIVAILIGCMMWIFFGAAGLPFVLIYLAFFLLSGIGIPLLTYLLGRHVSVAIVQKRADLHAYMVDSVQGSADLLAFGLEESYANRIATLSKELARLQMIMARISGLQNSLMSLFMNLSAWTMLLVAIPLVASGQLHGAWLAVLVLATLGSFEIIIPLPTAFQQVGGTLEAARRLYEIVDAPPVVQHPTKPSPQPQNYTLTVQQLGFSYNDTDHPALHGVSFTLPEGKCVAIVGPSGAGKSTMAQLLLRYRDYQQGEIQIGGHDIRTFQPDDLYKLTGVVEQDTHLFNTSIRQNILLARSDASEEDLLHATQQAQLHPFIQSLPDGYDTEVGEQGLRLSGGERQRIAIARALLKNAPILLLDEPTVNLDAITERAIFQVLKTAGQKRTTLFITHRLVEMDMADEILVLDQGTIVERGTHTQLIQAEGLYWRMWQQQQSLSVLHPENCDN